jgi:hypothetical protein
MLYQIEKHSNGVESSLSKNKKSKNHHTSQRSHDSDSQAMPLIATTERLLQQVLGHKQYAVVSNCSKGIQIRRGQFSPHLSLGFQISARSH